jgi:hypothetical protein
MQRLCKQATIPELSLGNESASNNEKTVGSYVFCEIRAEIYRKAIRTSPVSLQWEYGFGVRWSPVCEDVGSEVEERPPVEAT